MLSGAKHLWSVAMPEIGAEMIRDGKPGLAPNAFGAALQLRFAQNDIMGTTHAGSGAAMSVNGEDRSGFASANWRCLRPSQMLRTHQIAPIGTATQEMPASPKPSHRING